MDTFHIGLAYLGYAVAGVLTATGVIVLPFTTIEAGVRCPCKLEVFSFSEQAPPACMGKNLNTSTPMIVVGNEQGPPIVMLFPGSTDSLMYCQSFNADGRRGGAGFGLSPEKVRVCKEALVRLAKELDAVFGLAINDGCF